MRIPRKLPRITKNTPLTYPARKAQIEAAKAGDVPRRSLEERALEILQALAEEGRSSEELRAVNKQLRPAAGRTQESLTKTWNSKFLPGSADPKTQPISGTGKTSRTIALPPGPLAEILDPINWELVNRHTAGTVGEKKLPRMPAEQDLWTAQESAELRRAEAMVDKPMRAVASDLTTPDDPAELAPLREIGQKIQELERTAAALRRSGQKRDAYNAAQEARALREQGITASKEIFDRPYKPGEGGVEEKILMDHGIEDPKEAESALKSFQSLANRMSKESYVKFLREAAADPDQGEMFLASLRRKVALEALPDGSVREKAAAKARPSVDDHRTAVGEAVSFDEEILRPELLPRDLQNALGLAQRSGKGESSALRLPRITIPGNEVAPGVYGEDPQIAKIPGGPASDGRTWEQLVLETRGNPRLVPGEEGGRSRVVIPGEVVRRELGGAPVAEGEVPAGRPGPVTDMVNQIRDAKNRREIADRVRTLGDAPTYGPDVPGVGDFVAIAGKKIRGRVVSVSGGPRMVDAVQLPKGFRGGAGSEADRIYGNPVHSTFRPEDAGIPTVLRKGRAKPKMGPGGLEEPDEWVDETKVVRGVKGAEEKGFRTSSRKAAEPLVRVELPSGKIIQLPAAKVRRVRGPQLSSAEGFKESRAEGLAAELNERAPFVVSPEIKEKAAKAGGSLWLGKNAWAGRAKSLRNNIEILDPVPDSSGNILIRKGKAEPELMPREQAVGLGILDPKESTVSYARGGGRVAEGVEKALLRAEKLVVSGFDPKGVRGTDLQNAKKQRIVPHKGKTLRVMDGGDEVLVEVIAKPFLRDGEIFTPWQEVARKKAGEAEWQRVDQAELDARMRDFENEQAEAREIRALMARGQEATAEVPEGNSTIWLPPTPGTEHLVPPKPLKLRIDAPGVGREAPSAPPPAETPKGTKHFSMEFDFAGNAREGVKSASTFDAIWNGERTGTTRGGMGARVGDHILITRRGEKRQILAKITAVHRVTKKDAADPAFRESWSQREGWRPEKLNELVGKKSYAFEVVGKREDAKQPWGRDSAESAPATGIKIISGGQTGADEAGLRVGKELGLETGGWAPKGYRTANGPNPKLKEFGLQETDDPGFRERTIRNVKEADATVWFGNEGSPGGKLTLGQAKASKKPVLINPSPEELQEFVKKHNIKTLNVAGNREHTNPGIGEKAAEVLRKGLKNLGSSAGMALGAGITSVLGLLLGEGEAEAARRPSVSPAIEKIARQQNAPVRDVASLPLWTRAKIKASNTQDLVESASQERLKRFAGELSPEDAVANRLPPLLRGGAGPSDRKIDEIGDIVRPFQREGTDTQFQHYLNLNAYLREFRIVKEKIARDSHDAAAAYSRGQNDLGDRLSLRVEALKKKLATNTVVPEGLSEEDVKANLLNLVQGMDPDLAERMGVAANRVYSLTRSMLDEAHNEGLITDEAYSLYTSRGDDYIPLHRIMQVFNEETGEWIRARYSRELAEGRSVNAVRMSLLDEDEINQEIMGSPRVNINPLIATGHYIEGVNNEITRNKLARIILEEAEKFPLNDPILDVRRVDADWQPDEAAGRKKVGFLDKGIPENFDVSRDLYNTISNVDPEMATIFARQRGRVRQLTQLLVATANPPFMAAQVFKDIGAALTKPDYNRYTGGSEMLPWKDLGTFMGTWAKEMVQSYKENAAKGVDWATSGKVAPTWGDLPAASPFAKSRKAFDESGAAARAVGVAPRIEPQVLGPKRGIWDRRHSNIGGILQMFEHYLQQGMTVGLLQPIERANKHASFATLRKRGFGPNEAATQTRKFGGSPDFAQYGEVGKQMRDDVLFVNPAIQGTASFFEAVKNDPIKWTKIFGGLTAAIAMAHAHNAQFEDPETGERLINKVSKADRQGNFILLDGGMEQLPNGDRAPTGTKIPLPFEFSMILGPAFAVLESDIDQDYSLGEGVVDVVDNLIPVGGGSLNAASGEDLFWSSLNKGVSSLNPLWRVPIEEILNSQTLSGTPIVGTRIGNLPEEAQETLSTPQWAQEVGEATGMSPRRIDHVGKGLLFPGLLGVIPKTAEALLPPSPGQDLEGPRISATRTPMIGDLLRRFSLPSSTYNEERARKLDFLYSVGERTREAASLLSSRSGRDPEAITDIPRSMLIMAKVNGAVTRIQNALTQIDKAREVTIRSSSIPPEAKKQTLRELWVKEQEFLAATDVLMRRLQDEGVVQR